MRYQWNPAKRASNAAKHGVDFAELEQFDWPVASVIADTRRNYGEVRLTAMAPIGSRVHVLVFTIRRTAIWVISLRRANRKEVKRYAAETGIAVSG